MKKLYYIFPLVIVPCALFLLELFDNNNLIKMSPYIVGAVLSILSIIIGIFTPTQRKFDCFITLIMPLSLFVTMFLGGFFESSETYSAFNIFRATKVAFQPVCIIMYVIMATVTFLASSELIRLRHRKGHD